MWIAYKISESKCSEIIATRDTFIGNLNTKLTDSEKAKDSLQTQLQVAQNALAPWVTLANSKFGDKPQDERLPLLLDDIFTTMEERFDRLSIQLSE
ncbi:MAG TPA: hypothetical protein VIS71_04540, partial [Terrimicrobium sp.]